MTMTEHFPWSLEYVLHEFLFKSHEKKKIELKKGILRALESGLLFLLLILKKISKSGKALSWKCTDLGNFKTQLLELVESSMEVPIRVENKDPPRLKITASK